MPAAAAAGSTEGWPPTGGMLKQSRQQGVTPRVTAGCCKSRTPKITSRTAKKSRCARRREVTSAVVRRRRPTPPRGSPQILLRGWSACLLPAPHAPAWPAVTVVATTGMDGASAARSFGSEAQPARGYGIQWDTAIAGLASLIRAWPGALCLFCHQGGRRPTRF